jgi:hypothetical protein
VTDPAALRAAVEGSVVALDGVVVGGGERGAPQTWSRGGVEFCRWSPAGVELRVGEPIAAAAVRTPDTTPGDLGRDWIAFAPRELDDHARDRLGAWVVAAHRRAVPGG